MADIDIQRKTTPVWPWILGIIIVVAIILFLVAGRDREQLQNVGGGPNDTDRPIPGETVNPPSPANPDAPNRPDGRNPQVPPATPERSNPSPAPSESTVDDATKPDQGASLELQPTDEVFTDQNIELAQQNIEGENHYIETEEPYIEDEELYIKEDDEFIEGTDPYIEEQDDYIDADSTNTDADDPNAENSVIIFDDDEITDENANNPQFEGTSPEVAVFSQYLIQNSDIPKESTPFFTADGIRNLNDALYVLSAQDDEVLSEQRDDNRAQLDELADQIDNTSSQSEQARHTADAFSLAADWIEEVSQVLYPNTEPQAQATLQAADEFDPEQSLNQQLPAVRAFFDRADSALQEMAST